MPAEQQIEVEGSLVSVEAAHAECACTGAPDAQRRVTVLPLHRIAVASSGWRVEELVSAVRLRCSPTRRQAVELVWRKDIRETALQKCYEWGG